MEKYPTIELNFEQFLSVGISTSTRDRMDLRSWEENVGEGWLETIGGVIAGVNFGVVIVGVHKLDPDLLDGTELTEMELVISVDHVENLKIVSAKIGLFGTPGGAVRVGDRGSLIKILLFKKKQKLCCQFFLFPYS